LQNIPVIDGVHTEDPQVQVSAFAKDPLLMGQFLKEHWLVNESQRGPVPSEHNSVPQRQGDVFGTIPLTCAHIGPRKHKHVESWAPHDTKESTFVFCRISLPPVYEKQPFGREVEE
jgi:hypothetical protein